MPKKIHYLFTLARCFLSKEAQPTEGSLLGRINLLFFFNKQALSNLDILTHDNFKKVKLLFKDFFAEQITKVPSLVSPKEVIQND